MTRNAKTRDDQLVRECLQGSRDAWEEFYSRFIDLVRCLIRRKPGITPLDMEDLAQSTFLELATSLKSFAAGDSLAGFVCMVTERTLIDEFRRSTASKRDGRTEPVDHHDGEGEGSTMIPSDLDLQDRLLEKAEETMCLNEALKALDPRCRELIELRYFRELSFSEVGQTIGATENTVTVQTRRCLNKLRLLCQEHEPTGRQP